MGLDDMFGDEGEFGGGLERPPSYRGRNFPPARPSGIGPVKPQTSMERDYIAEAADMISQIEELGGDLQDPTMVNIDPRNPLSGMYVILGHILALHYDLRHLASVASCLDGGDEDKRPGTNSASEKGILQEFIKVLEKLAASLQTYVEESKAEKEGIALKEPDDPSQPVTNRNFIEGLDRNFSALLRAMEKMPKDMGGGVQRGGFIKLLATAIFGGVVGGACLIGACAFTGIIPLPF